MTLTTILITTLIGMAAGVVCAAIGLFTGISITDRVTVDIFARHGRLSHLLMRRATAKRAELQEAGEL